MDGWWKESVLVCGQTGIKLLWREALFIRVNRGCATKFAAFTSPRKLEFTLAAIITLFQRLTVHLAFYNNNCLGSAQHFYGVRHR